MPRADLLRRLACCLSLGSLLVIAPAHAIDWDELSPRQQETLAELAPRWDDLPLERRARLVERADRWHAMPADKREAIHSRWQEIKQLPPEARQTLRLHWESMTPEQQREAVRDWKVKKQGRGQP